MAGASNRRAKQAWAGGRPIGAARLAGLLFVGLAGCSLDVGGLTSGKDLVAPVKGLDGGATDGALPVDRPDADGTVPSDGAGGETSFALETASFSNALAGTKDVLLTVTGRGIQTGASVTFNGATYKLTRSGSSWLAERMNLPDKGGRYLLAIANAPPDKGEDSRLMDVLWPAPSLGGVKASTAAAGATNVTLNLQGSGFVEGTKVLLGAEFPASASLSTKVLSATELRVTGVSLPVTGGEFTVAVANPEPTATTNAATKLTVLPTIGTCASHKRTTPAATTGLYALDPDGKGPNFAFPAFCEMNTDGSGWALVLTTSKGSGALCIQQGSTPASCAESFGAPPVVPGSGSYLAKDLVVRLATASSRMHIRTEGQGATRSITSVPNRFPIENFRKGNMATTPFATPSAGLWTGPNPVAGNLSRGRANDGCDDDLPYPVIFNASCNFGGLHLGPTGSPPSWASRWSYGASDEPMEAYLGGEATDAPGCAPGYHDSNGATAGGDCLADAVGGAGVCDSGYTDSNGATNGGTCVLYTAEGAACETGFIDSNGVSPGGTCVAVGTAGTAILCDSGYEDSNGTLVGGSCILGNYTVRYNGNGSTSGAAPPSTTTTFQSTVNVGYGGTLQRLGYSFAGWTTVADGSGVTYAPGDSFPMGPGDLNLYARWTPITPSVTAVALTSAVAATTGVTLTLTGTGFDAGNKVTFNGVSYTGIVADGGATFVVPGVDLPAVAGSYNLATTNSANQTSTAFAVLICAAGNIDSNGSAAGGSCVARYTVTYQANGGSGSPPTDGNSYDASATVTVADAGTLARTGYSFGGWNTAADTSGVFHAAGSFFTLSGSNITLYAVWNAHCPAAGGTWVSVPGSSIYGTPDFCVQKYVPSNGSGVALSQPDALPWVSISHATAKDTCNALGTGFHLITNPEWMTVATNIAQVGANWTGGAVGSGELTRGHSDNTPPQICAADANDANAWVQGDCTGSPQGSQSFAQRRTWALSNGQTLWDIGGNVFQWVDYTNTNDKPMAPAAYWMEYPVITGTTTTPRSHLVPIHNVQPWWDDSWNSGQSIGQFYPGTNGAGGALRRGGYFMPTGSNEKSGMFTAAMNTSSPAGHIGFRCAYQPATYTLVYDGNGASSGTLPTDAKTYVTTQPVSVSAAGTLARSGFTFAGWNTAANGSGSAFAAGSTFVMGAATVRLYAQWAVPCGASGNRCYDNAAAMAAGKALTPSGKSLVLTQGVWVDATWSRVLAADGSDDWANGLSLDGRHYTMNLLDKANVAGRACPAHVFVPGNLTATGRCLYYDGANGLQRLDAPNNDGLTDQVTAGSIRLSGWNNTSSGLGAAGSWYEGNIQTCAAKGMRLPTLYETQAAAPSSGAPTDATPSFGGASRVPPSPVSMDTVWTWTATAATDVGPFAYFGWVSSGSTAGANYDQAVRSVRCVAPGEAAPFYVLYDRNGSTGGSEPDDSALHTATEAVTVLGNTGGLTKDGFEFAGWNTAADGSGTNYQGGDVFPMPPGNVILYAMWRLPM